MAHTFTAFLLSSLCAQCHGGTASFNDIATALDAASGRQPSRQSVAERFAQPCLRRMKAKKETKGYNPSAAVLELMGWATFITNLGPEVSFSALLETYGLRWRIEVIFKAWKSQMDFHVIHRVSELELKICLTAKLVSITVGMGHLYRL